MTTNLEGTYTYEDTYVELNFVLTTTKIYISTQKAYLNRENSITRDNLQSFKVNFTSENNSHDYIIFLFSKTKEQSAMY
jgi:hypothetical protein